MMFYDSLKRACDIQNTTPSAVALAAGMSKANVTNWKNGAIPNLATVSRLAKALDVPIADLLQTDTTKCAQ